MKSGMEVDGSAGTEGDRLVTADETTIVPVRFRVLGPMSAQVDGVPAWLGGRISKAIVARLLIARPRVATEDQLIEAAWGHRPPATARQNLQHHIAALRRSLEPRRQPRGGCGVLVRHAGGYLLEVPDEAVDEAVFTQHARAGHAALAAGDPAGAVRLLGTALALWRGPAFADLADVEALRAYVARLVERHTSVREDHVAAKLATGRHQDALAEARELTVEHPLRERGWQLCALAAYRSGRQADALALLRTAGAVFREELGVDSGPELSALTGALLRRDSALDWYPPRAPAPAPNSPVSLSTFVGRTAELATLHSLTAQNRLVTIVGPPGVGKSRLAREMLATVSGALPPVVAVGDSTLATALAVAVGVPAGGDSLAATIGDGAAVLVLDGCDDHLAEAAVLVCDLLRRFPRLRVVTTSRQPLGVSGEIRFELAPLGGDGGRLLIDRIAESGPGWAPGPQERWLADEISRGLGGLPLALELAAAHGRVMSLRQLHHAVAGSMSLLTDPRLGSFAAAVTPSLLRLSPRSATFLRRLADHTGEFDGAAAARVGGVDDPMPLLADLVDRSLVTVVPYSCPRRFRILEPIRLVLVAQPTAPHPPVPRPRPRSTGRRLVRRPGIPSAMAR